ncbi:GNAT family N-acetyltransferase [Tropicimonas sp. IMCC34043]|uniref:GNAT family N-acetyltransferase n=1 Tax=Tropicimonas sp. IMCC34043 TaxID=2248760 RepID=UPI001E48EC04|nr:GNAT family N-acetyltransferase [Tropicimonas sp. IMCC34043]
MELKSISGQPVIPAARVTLRPLQKSDKGLLDLYAGDQRVARATRSIPHPLPPGTAEAYIARSLAENRREDVWALDGTPSGLGELVGVISLTRMEDAKAKSEISYWVAPILWNTGLASEAVRALLAANPQNSDTIFAEVFQDNQISARVLTNAGFTYLGDAEAFSVARNSSVPTWTYLKKLR